MMVTSRIFVLAAVLSAAALLAGCNGSGGHLSLRSVATGATYTPPLPTAVYRYRDINTADIYLSDIPMEVLANPDIDLREWAAAEGRRGGGPGNGRGATLVHIHLFVLPKAGKTPIDPTACNVTLRQLVLAPPRAAAEGTDRAEEQPAVLGLYGGGGFVRPGRGWFGTGGTPGATTFSGSIRRGEGYGEADGDGLSGDGRGGLGEGGGGTLRLIRAEPGFVDPIGPAEMSGSFTAVLDEPLADVMAARLEKLVASIPEVRQPEPQIDAPGPPMTP